jgi:Superinfection immunity protein
MVRALLIIAFLAAWFLPLIIAALYKLPHQGSIAVLSLALGWTGVGWLAALVIVVGGAIRATRPPLPVQEAAGTPAPAYPPAQVRVPAQPPERAAHPERAQAERTQLPRRTPGEQTEPLGRAQPPERPAPRWPDNPR